MPRNLLRLFIFLMPLCSLLATSCSDNRTSRPIVTVSIPPQKMLLEQIVGDRYDIRCLLAGASDPENYDPSFTNLLNTDKSVAFLRMGNIGFEEAVTSKIRNSSPDLPIFNTSEGVEPITGTHAPGEIDPHTWTSVANARIIAANMLKAMTTVDPENSELFTENYNRLTQRLDSLDNALRSTLAGARCRAFVVWHPSLSYFARDYGLTQIVVGGVENKEITIPALQSNIEKARESGARIMFVQKEADSRQAETVSSHIGTRTVDIRPLSYEWADELTKIAREIATQ